jgi:hypothetical protein
VIGTNQLAEAAPNGDTMGFFTIDVVAQLLGNPALRANYADFLMLAAVEEPLVAYARKDTPPGLKVATDICKTPPAVDGPYFPTRNNHLRDIAKNFIDNNVDLLIAAGGSRSADVAIKQRGSANKPVIVFTSVAPYICNNLNKNTTTGVCAHTSDHDVDRLD